MLYYHFINRDFLIFRGKERLDFINRLSTNQVDKLQIYQGLKTFLTSDKGRIIDLLSLFVFEDFVLTMCADNNGLKVKSHLDKYTIMDDFNCEDISETHECILFYGEYVAKFAKDELSFELDKYSNNDFKIIKLDSYDILVSPNDDGFGGVTVIYPIEAKKAFKLKFLSNEITEKYNMLSMNNADFDTTRIELGIPSAPNEINESINPLECGLSKYVNFTKGCYIGQEVIARLDTYDKVSKHLTGIKFSVPEKIDLSAALIYTDKNECGQVTSFAQSDKFGQIGLGYIKTAFLNYENEYQININNRIINCKLNKLPF